MWVWTNALWLSFFYSPGGNYSRVWCRPDENGREGYTPDVLARECSNEYAQPLLDACHDAPASKGSGSGASGSGGSDSGGSSGGSGASSDCDAYCADYHGAGCDSGPGTLADCVTFCEGLLASSCADEQQAFADCADGKDWICGDDGFPTVDGCDDLRTAASECINGLSGSGGASDGSGGATGQTITSSQIESCNINASLHAHFTETLGCVDDADQVIAFCEGLYDQGACLDEWEALVACAEAEPDSSFECDENNRLSLKAGVCDMDVASFDTCASQ